MSEVTLDDNAALLVVDVQKGFDVEGFWGPRDNPECEANISRLLAAWSDAGRPIVAIRHDSVVPGSPLGLGQPGNALKDLVSAVAHDVLVTKSVNSAFYGEPDLHTWLRERGIGQIVICGIQTNMCCETTARMGGNLGYDVLFVLDACHTFDLAGRDGHTLDAATLSATTAVNLHGGDFARVIDTGELVGPSA
jgi:nicotinamidase-related amidase